MLWHMLCNWRGMHNVLEGGGGKTSRIGLIVVNASFTKHFAKNYSYPIRGLTLNFIFHVMRIPLQFIGKKSVRVKQLHCIYILFSNLFTLFAKSAIHAGVLKNYTFAQLPI